MTRMDQVFIMPDTIYSSNIFGSCANRRLNANKSMSLQWIVLIWLTALLPATKYHAAHGLDQLHIGGIFPIGGKGEWQHHLSIILCYQFHLVMRLKKI